VQLEAGLVEPAQEVVLEGEPRARRLDGADGDLDGLVEVLVGILLQRPEQVDECLAGVGEVADERGELDVERAQELNGLEVARVLARVGAQLVSPCLLYTSPSPRDRTRSRMPSSA